MACAAQAASDSQNLPSAVELHPVKMARQIGHDPIFSRFKVWSLALDDRLIKMERNVRLELTTPALKARYSTSELRYLNGGCCKN